MTTQPSVWRHIGDAGQLAERLIELYGRRGNECYDEAVTQTEHAVQAATIARADGGDDALVVAALLHDIGHLLLDQLERASEFRQRDLHHEQVGARFLSNWYPAAVTEPVRHHVAAKRYLCAVDPAYYDMLSSASIDSLERQGGPLSAAEASAYAAQPFVPQAQRLRRYDDLAKQVDIRSRRFSDFHDLLARTATIYLP